MSMASRGRVGVGLAGLLLLATPSATASQCHSIQAAAQQLDIDVQSAFEGSDMDSAFQLDEVCP